MTHALRFNRMELAGSLGDLGTLLPLAIGMILINGLDPVGLFCGVGVYYIFSGLYFGVTTPVEPMKVIGAYAVATGVGAGQIVASSAWTSLFLLVIGSTGAITLIGRYIPRPVIRGVQLSTGVLLITQGVKLILGTSKFQALSQAAEPYLTGWPWRPSCCWTTAGSRRPWWWWAWDSPWGSSWAPTRGSTGLL
jgi:SulP family sulfate permease